MKRNALSWAMYDFANSAFATTVMAGFFPIFFKEYYSFGVEATTSTAMLGITNSIASFFIVIFAPLLGSISDNLSLKKRFLFIFTYLGILMSAMLGLIYKGEWELALFFYLLANIGFAGANIFYDSLIGFVAEKEKRDFISGLGYSLGYLGGGILFALNVFMYQKPEFFGLSDGVEAIKYSFFSVGIWWAIFSIPIFLFVKEPIREEKGSLLSGYRELISTFKKIKELKMIFLFLIAYWFYIDGVDSVIKMAVDYGISIGFNASDLIKALLLIQFIGFPATIIFAKFGEKIGTKKAILFGIGIYFIIILWAIVMESKFEFYAISILIGVAQGGIQALSRSYYSKMIPLNQSGEFFGFYNMMGKFASILGPMLIGLTALFTKDSRVSIASILILFIIGGFLLLKVDEERAREEAKLF